MGPGLLQGVSPGPRTEITLHNSVKILFHSVGAQCLCREITTMLHSFSSSLAVRKTGALAFREEGQGSQLFCLWEVARPLR